MGRISGLRVIKSLVCPTPKYRFVAVPSHRDAVPLYMGEAGVQGFFASYVRSSFS
jgi:hypothetical protein